MVFPSRRVPVNNATVPDIAPWAQATNTDDVPKLLTPRPPQILEHTLATGLTTNVFAAQRADWRSRTTVFTGTGTGSRIFNIGSGAFQDGDWLELRRNSTGAVSLMLLAGQTFSDGTSVRTLRENETIRIIHSGTVWYYTTDSGGAVSADRLPQLRQRFAFYQNSNRALTQLTGGGNFGTATDIQTIQVNGMGTFDGRSTIDMWGTDAPIWNVTGNYIDYSQLMKNENLELIINISTIGRFPDRGFQFKPTYRDGMNTLIRRGPCWIYNYSTPLTGSNTSRDNASIGINFTVEDVPNAERLSIDFVNIDSDETQISIQNITIQGESYYA